MVAKPALFIAGAPKCGTTSLAAWLDQHPRVRVSPVKEANFFNVDMGFRRFRDEADYLAHFDVGSSDPALLVDATPWYLASTVAARRILDFNPDARFVILLRDPTEMAVSLHAQLLSTGGEDVPDFSEAWALQEARRQGRSLPLTATEPATLQYRDICATGTQSRRLLEVVPEPQVRFVLLDDLRRDPGAVVSAICEWMALPHHVALDLSPRNERHRARWRFLRDAVALAARAQTAGYLPRLNTGLGGVLRRINRAKGSGAVVDGAFLDQVVRPAFEPEVSLIREITGRPLADWGTAA